MQIDYRIVFFDKSVGSIWVQYYSLEAEGLPVLKLDLPVTDGAFPIGDALEEFIRSYTPTHFYDRNLALASAPDGSHIDAQIRPHATPPFDLASSVKGAQDFIDQTAGTVRAAFITVAPGQEATYLMKAQQADAYAANNFEGDVPPYIALEATTTGKTPQEVATNVIATRDYWNNVINPQIESQRIGGKQRVAAATTVEELNTMQSEIYMSLLSIGAQAS